ncbi:MAG: hypothetical protein HYY11_00810 [Candidatus Methylomirabilis oxyfera]|nr:hypothetical protein [Candidatus Methylomirabilis oxyfera]
MYRPWKRSQAEGVATLSANPVNRRDLIKRGLAAAAGLVIAKTMSASAEAPTAPRARRAPVDRTQLPSWRTRVRIIDK